MALKTKLYRVQFSCTKPSTENIKYSAFSNIIFCLAKKESDCRDYVDEIVAEIRMQKGKEDLFLKSIKIEQQKFTGIKNLVKEP